MNNQKDSFSIPAHFNSIKEAAEFWRLCKEYWDVVEELEFEVNSVYFYNDLAKLEMPEVHESGPKSA